MRKKVLQVCVAPQMHKQILQTQKDMKKFSPGWEPSISNAIQHLINDRQLHRLKLIDLTAAQSSLTAKISENLHALKYPTQDVQKVMLAIAEAIQFEHGKAANQFTIK